jgi:hypothetical protein
VADLIDNSIDAKATQVRVDFRFDGEDSWVRIADNGRGMPPDALDEAMTYGTRKEYEESDLGKFGLGLKISSLSQCRRLTVATRTDKQRRVIQAQCWDLDFVDERDSWDVILLDAGDCRPEILEPLQEHPGTVIFWEKLDRVMSYTNPLGKSANKGFATLCREVEEHLAMVFHRFISGRAKGRLPLSIFVNDNPVEPWDPFAEDEPKTQPVPAQELGLEHEGCVHQVIVRPFVLPNESQFSSPKAWERASGPRKWNAQQGFYVYRNDRMIQSGGWNRIRTPDEHTKLARIAIDFTADADAAFEINVSKMRVSLPAEIRSSLTVIASGVVAKANATYRQKGEKTHPVPQHGAKPSAAVVDPPDRGHYHGASDPGPSTTSETSYSLALAMVVVAVLQRELAGQPALLAKVLKSLARMHEDFRKAVNRSEVSA